MINDLPEGYRWATEAETEEYNADPITHPDMLVVVRTADSSGVLYTQEEADLALPAKRLVPDFSLDVFGTYQGNAYPATHEYRVTMAHDPEDGAQLLVTDSGGAPVAKPLVIDDALADGIMRMSSTDHSLSGYEDDWAIPDGMNRGIYWVLQTDMDHYVQLGPDGIEKIADWLTYVFGEMTWDWATDGEVYES